MSALEEELAEQIRKKLNSDDIKLPSLPDTVIKVQKLMASDDYSVADISNIIKNDATFAAVIMRIVNSVRFNTSGHEIRNLGMAIQRIGPNQILKLLIGIASRLFCNVKNPELRNNITKVHEHTLSVSAASESIARLTKAADPADTFMASLLHDQGKDVLIACIPDELLSVPYEQRLLICETFHREMGARLLHKWGLPEDFVLVAQHHGIESPDRPKLPMLDCLDVADALIHMEEDGIITDFSKYQPAQRLRINETQLAGISMDIEDQIAELRQTFAG